MASGLNEFGPQQQKAFANSAKSFMGKGTFLAHVPPNSQLHRGQLYLHPAPAIVGSNLRGTDMASLAHGFGGLSLQHPSYAAPTKPNAQLSPASSEYSGVPMGQPHFFPPTTPVMYPASVQQGTAQASNGVAHSPGLYQPIAPYYVPQANYSGYPQHLVENSPLATTWTPRVSSGEMPTLITPERRDSASSNENDAPGTPFAGYGLHNGVAVVDRSPSVVFTHSGTPSPSHIGLPYIVPHVVKPQAASTIPLSLQLLLQQEPAIPRAIPAPSSPVKPLDRSLENNNGETNVYIRGLLPETTDEMLQEWGKRFGDIQSSKSIIDHKTNLCKGFGFIRYHNYEDAENCIRGFHHLGYEVSFARESFYAKLKKFSDETNTNLYVSNLPKDMNEHELSAIFAPHKVCSSRILRDGGGIGRGVGFARFESREICEEVIKDFNNTPVAKAGGEEHIIQIRYADTAEQKVLKQRTAAARQFRTAEYEYGVQARNQGIIPAQRLTSLTTEQHDAADEFENFLTRNVGTLDQRYSHPMLRQLPVRQFAIAQPHRVNGPVMAPQVIFPPVVHLENNSADDAGAKLRPTTPVNSHSKTSATSSKASSPRE